MSDLTFADSVRLAADEHGAVLLDSRGGQMYGLNPAAAIFCAALAEGASREKATQAVFDAFDAEEAVIRADLEQLVAELRDRNLLREDE
jgi:Coenzyme PQQ synthesis protein D (PqqD)